MSLAGLAQETLAICESGRYTLSDDDAADADADADVDADVSRARPRDIDISDAVRAAIEGTVLHAPGELDPTPPPNSATAATLRADVEVSAESTVDAIHRLFRRHGEVGALNFASARHPGGGFLGGAKAQEEDLARCSALYVCQRTQPRYYEANRAHSDLAYTDHLIVSPRVPFFRERRLRLVSPSLATIVTAPAPNAGEILRRSPDATAQISSTLRRRAALVLAAAATHGTRHLVLGAWGCGVFRNDPVEVATVFAEQLEAGWSRAFATITFAILDRSKTQATLHAFEAVFASRA